MHEQPPVRLAVNPGASVATLVLRQKRRRLNVDGTVSVLNCGPLTMKSVPLSAFSGRPPSATGSPSRVGATLNLGSRQVPVHVGGSCGSRRLLAWVSLYDTSVRYAVFVPSML